MIADNSDSLKENNPDETGVACCHHPQKLKHPEKHRHPVLNSARFSRSHLPHVPDFLNTFLLNDFEEVDKHMKHVPRSRIFHSERQYEGWEDDYRRNEVMESVPMSSDYYIGIVDVDENDASDDSDEDRETDISGSGSGGESGDDDDEESTQEYHTGIDTGFGDHISDSEEGDHISWFAPPVVWNNVQGEDVGNEYRAKAPVTHETVLSEIVDEDRPTNRQTISNNRQNNRQTESHKQQTEKRTDTQKQLSDRRTNTNNQQTNRQTDSHRNQTQAAPLTAVGKQFIQPALYVPALPMNSSTYTAYQPSGGETGFQPTVSSIQQSATVPPLQTFQQESVPQNVPQHPNYNYMAKLALASTNVTLLQLKKDGNLSAIPAGKLKASRVCKPGPLRPANPNPNIPNCLIIGDSISLR